MIAGSVLNVAAGTRSLVASRTLNRAGQEVEIRSLSLESQHCSVDPFQLLELLVNGAVVFSDWWPVTGAARSSRRAIPFLRFPAVGTFEAYVSNGSAVAETFAFQLVGRYVPLPEYQLPG